MEIIYYVAASLDGFIATPDGGIDWLKPYEGGVEDYGYGEFYASIEAVLLGRATYEKCLEFREWPYAGKPYWVFSRANGNTPASVAAEMKARGLRRAWLVGGGKLAAAFRAERLITEHIVSIIPVLLGAGIPLYHGRGPRDDLRLKSSRSYPSGIVQLRYETAL
ncbi:MAG TPA: dihydrofolate reductase family protein [Burkholderiales bacterium]|nr:dihydrofolate reductase family protein [Burkholderiales bacterium]